MVTVFRRKLGWLACFVALAAVAILAAAVFYALSALGVGQCTAYVCFVVPRPESLVDRLPACQPPTPRTVFRSSRPPMRKS